MSPEEMMDFLKIKDEHTRMVRALRHYAKKDQMQAFERGRREPEFQHPIGHVAENLLRDIGQWVSDERPQPPRK